MSSSALTTNQVLTTNRTSGQDLRVGGGDVPPAPLSAPELGRRSTIGDLVGAALADGTQRLVDHDPGICRDGDPECVHQARTATRRLRADLRTLGPLLDADATQLLRDELAWLGGLLGAVRDADVLAAGLGADAGRLPVADQPAAQALLARLQRGHDLQLGALREALAGERYARLLEQLRGAARQPPLAAGVDAGRPARPVIAARTDHAWKRVARAVRRLDDNPDDAALHEVRKRAKRARYAAELASGVVGKPARRLARRLSELQDVLGESQDAVVAGRWLRELPWASLPAAEVFAAGELHRAVADARSSARAAWPDAWHRARRRELRAWTRSRS